MSSTAADARPPKRASYVNLYKWPESDVDFVKSAAGGGRAHRSSCSKRKWVLGQPSPSDRYSWRQMYLRSYVFTTKKETVPERTRRYLRRVKTRVARLPLLMRRMRDDGIQLYYWKTKKKGCGEVMVRKLKSLVGRFLSYTTGPGGSVYDN